MELPDFLNEELDQFQMGVLYERTRIMDLLRTALPDDLHGLIRECNEKETVPVLPLEGILDFANLVMSQPVHTRDEAGNNIVNGYPLTVEAAIRAMQSITEVELREQLGSHPVLDELIQRVLGERSN